MLDYLPLSVRFTFSQPFRISRIMLNTQTQLELLTMKVKRWRWLSNINFYGYTFTSCWYRVSLMDALHTIKAVRNYTFNIWKYMLKGIKCLGTDYRCSQRGHKKGTMVVGLVIPLSLVGMTLVLSCIQALVFVVKQTESVLKFASSLSLIRH